MKLKKMIITAVLNEGIKYVEKNPEENMGKLLMLKYFLEKTMMNWHQESINWLRCLSPRKEKLPLAIKWLVVMEIKEL